MANSKPFKQIYVCIHILINHLGSEKLTLYYITLTFGTLLVLFSIIYFIIFYSYKELTFFKIVKIILAFLFGILILTTTLPSLKDILLKDFDVVSGECIIEIDTSNRSATAEFIMLDTDDKFMFDDVPDLDAYGKAIPYYCELTLTKDHMWEICYKIYDVSSRELILTSK